MNPRNNQQFGKQGEMIAVNFLKNQGYSIVEKNFHQGYSEIDIIAKEADTLVFVEVKTRAGDEFGTPEEAITPWKLRNLKRAAEFYILCNPVGESSVRIDAVCISMGVDGKVKSINLYKNITS